MTEVIANNVLQLVNCTLLDRLSTPYLGHINKAHDQILKDQRVLTGLGYYVIGEQQFSGMGKRVMPLMLSRNSNAIPLHPSLRTAHENWFQMFDRHLREWKAITQQLSSIVLRLKTWQEYRDVFPEHVISHVLSEPELVGLVRRNDCAYPGNPRSMDPDVYATERLRCEAIWGHRPVHLYDQAAPLVDLYVGYKLL